MKATALFLAASTLAAVSAVAYDGYGYDPRPASFYNNTISGAAHMIPGMPIKTWWLPPC